MELNLLMAQDFYELFQCHARGWFYTNHHGHIRHNRHQNSAEVSLTLSRLKAKVTVRRIQKKHLTCARNRWLLTLSRLCAAWSKRVPPIIATIEIMQARPPSVATIATKPKDYANDYKHDLILRIPTKLFHIDQSRFQVVQLSIMLAL